MDVDLTIRGLQEAQAANNRRIAEMQPTGALGAVVRNLTVFTHRQALIVSHIDTGALRASHRMEVTGVRGQVFIDPRAVNPRSRVSVSEYAKFEHDRGGGHAFYRRAHQAGEQYLRTLIPYLAHKLAE